MKQRAMQLGILATLIAAGLIMSLGAPSQPTTDSPTIQAQPPGLPPPIRVLEQNLDANGFVRVHEQGTVPITGTVNVGNVPSIQDVRVTNAPLSVTGSVAVTNFPSSGGTTKIFDQEVFPFTTFQDFEVDIHRFSKIRIAITVNGSGTVHFFYGTDSGFRDSFDVDAGDSRSVLLGEVPGTRLGLSIRDPDGEQVFLRVFGG